MREGWVLDNLSNCIKLKSGNGLTAKKMISGEFPVFGGNGIAGHHNDFNLSGENIIIGRVGALCGNSRYINKKIWLTDNAFKVSEFKYDFNLEFLNYLLNYVDLRSFARQAAQPVISNSSLKNVKLSFPKSIQEQKQIVTVLDKAFTAIDQAKANIEKNIINAKELFQSKLNDIFSQKGDGWEEKNLIEICEVKDGTHDSPKYVDEKDGIPFVTQKNILENGISFENTKFISKNDHNHFYKRSNVAYNDILFAMIGANRGMACIVDDKRVFSIKNVGLIKSNENYRAKFILYFFKSPIAKKYVAENSSGSAQGFIGLTKLRAFKIPYTNIENQKKIELQIESLNDAINTTIFNYNLKLNSFEELKKSILQKAFAGELTQKEVLVK